jgi:hypothetical protein
VVVLALAGPACAGVPDWLRDAARLPLPQYEKTTDAVVLLDEQRTTVSSDGEIKTLYRHAYKILRAEGKSYGTLRVYFDNQTQLRSMKGWCLTQQGAEFEKKEKDAVETGVENGMLYADTRYKVLEMPGAEAGSVVGYEYEQRRRSAVLQDLWEVQQEIPVRRGLYVLQLPEGWEAQPLWLNFSERAAQTPGKNQWSWEVEDVAAVEEEPMMPAWRSVAGTLAITFHPKSGAAPQPSSTWNDVGVWYSQLSETQRAPTPEISASVAALTASPPNVLAKIRALAAFAQRDIRYVAIEVGVGAYQPHAAGDIFASKYGDCKDKVTLLSAMLRQMGVDSYYVLVHSRRGAVAPQFPSMLNFNHVIIAIRLPQEVPVGLYAAVEHPRLGRLLFFDPTDAYTPVGLLPSSLQTSYGLLVTKSGGELVQLPLMPATANLLERQGTFRLDPDGNLSGDVHEDLSGSFASSSRGSFLHYSREDTAKMIEDFLSQSVPVHVLRHAQILDLNVYENPLGMNYSFDAAGYAKKAGPLLIVRPRVLGHKREGSLEWSTGERKARKFPFEFAFASWERDAFEIAIPEGYAVDELPPPVEADCGVATYHSRVELAGKVLRYTREYRITGVRAERDQLDSLRKFFQAIAADEQNSAVLKRVGN